jgi:hypothetical protein
VSVQGRTRLARPLLSRQLYSILNIFFPFLSLSSRLAAVMLPTSVSKFPHPSIHSFIAHRRSTYFPRKRHIHPTPTRTPCSAREGVRRFLESLHRRSVDILRTHVTWTRFAVQSFYPWIVYHSSMVGFMQRHFLMREMMMVTVMDGDG